MHLTRESIFVNAVRSFCIAFSAVFGVLLSIIAVSVILMLFSEPTLSPAKSEITIAPDAQGSRQLLSFSSPAVLRIDFHGVIGADNLTSTDVETILLDAQEGLLKGGRIKAILLHMDTPGGTVVDSDGIYRALMEYKKKHQVPIYAYVDGLCASGGVYIASAADKIYADPSSVYGSVGVIIGPSFNVSAAMEKMGISSLTLSEGKDKDMLNPFRPWHPGEEQSLKNIVAAFYERFVNIVSAARPELSKTKLIQDYGAQVYIGTEAEALGYIDVANSDYATALSALTLAAGIEENQPYQVVSLKPPRSFLSEFIDGGCALLSGKVTHTFQLGGALSPEMSGKFLYLYQP